MLNLIGRSNVDVLNFVGGSRLRRWTWVHKVHEMHISCNYYLLIFFLFCCCCTSRKISLHAKFLRTFFCHSIFFVSFLNHRSSSGRTKIELIWLFAAIKHDFKGQCAKCPREMIYKFGDVAPIYRLTVFFTFFFFWRLFSSLKLRWEMETSGPNQANASWSDKFCFLLEKKTTTHNKAGKRQISYSFIHKSLIIMYVFLAQNFLSVSLNLSTFAVAPVAQKSRSHERQA